MRLQIEISARRRQPADRLIFSNEAWASYEYYGLDRPHVMRDWAGGALEWTTYNARGLREGRAFSWAITA